MNLNDLFTEEKVRLDPKCWTGKKIGNPKTKIKGGVRVNNCVPAESVNEMDKSQTPPGRDGSNDLDASKKEYTAKATTPEKVAKDAEKILNKELNKKQGVAEAGYPEVDHMPGAIRHDLAKKMRDSSCKRCHGHGTLWKAPNGTILPANDVPGAKRYKCGACDGIGMAKQGVAEGSSKKRHHFIYEADTSWSPELEKNNSDSAAKLQAYNDQRAQQKAEYIRQNAASNAEHVKQREEEYQARLQRDREAQEKQDARTKPGYQQRPGDDDPRQPHGDSANELKMFIAGSKPASAVGEMDLPLWRNLIDSGKYVVKQLFKEKGKPGSVVIGQPGEEDRVEKIASLIQNASDLADKGDFSAYHNSNYHRWLGRLLGYPADKIEKFIKGYFADVKDLAKDRFDENARKLTAAIITKT